MESISSILETSFPFKKYDEAECENCGRIYTLYETSRGAVGACKHCVNQQLLNELNVPTKEEREKRKERKFIAAFEHVTDDLSSATIESYEPKEKSQTRAKKIATQYVASFDGIQSLLFSGDCGLGKSHLSFAITKALRQKGYKTLYIKSQIYLIILKTPRSEEHTSELQSRFDI